MSLIIWTRTKACWISEAVIYCSRHGLAWILLCSMTIFLGRDRQKLPELAWYARVRGA